MTRRLSAAIWRGRRWLRRGRDNRGASLVEFALILPVFSLLLFGLIDFGMVFGGYITLENQVNGAARAIAVGRTAPPSSWPTGCSSASAPTPDLCTAAADIGTSFLGVVPGSVKVEVNYVQDGTETQGSSLVVCAQANTKSTTGLTSPILNGRTIRASSKVLLEQGAQDTLPSGVDDLTWPTGSVLSWCQ